MIQARMRFLQRGAFGRQSLLPVKAVEGGKDFDNGGYAEHFAQCHPGH
jgi:hypothetical protein